MPKANRVGIVGGETVSTARSNTHTYHLGAASVTTFAKGNLDVLGHPLVKGRKQPVFAASNPITLSLTETTTDSGVICYVPAGAIILGLGCLVTTEIAASELDDIGVQFGTTAEGAELVALDPDSMESSTTVLAGVLNGVGTFLDTANSALVLTAAANTFGSELPIHGRITVAGQALEGAVQFLVEYLPL